MPERTRRMGGGLAGRLATLTVLLAETGLAEDVGRPDEPLDLVLTQAELRSIIRNYEIKTGEILTAPIDDDEVIVVAPSWQAPMRVVSQEVGGGIAAPFWAIMHPKDAWRIFVPIPPKGPQRESEAPVPDPR